MSVSSARIQTISGSRWDRLKLVVIKGVDEGKQFVVHELITSLGRDPQSTILLHDTEVSRRHAEIERDDEGFVVRDLGSANGTFVNSEIIEQAPLRPGDQIQIGQSILVAIASQSAGRRKGAGNTDLADRISMITRQDVELSSAIIKTVTEEEGSKILAHPDQVKGPWLKNALFNLGILYELSQLVSHVLDVDELLERVLQLIFRALESDRGCILLRDRESGTLEPKAIHWRKGAPSDQETIPVSRTIVDHVIEHKQGILVSDAAKDDRFKTRQSIVRFGIREVICVPMKGRHETLGVLYVDTRSDLQDILHSPEALAAAEARDPETGPPVSRFNEDHLSLAIAIAHQAALAVEETRYYDAMLHAERLAAVGQTIAGLSHYIKNILQGLRSGSDILKMGLAEEICDRELIRQGWDIVEKNQGKIYNLVMDMLSFSKERAPVLEDVNLNNVASDVIELMQGKAKELGVRLTSRFADLPTCQADPEGVHRAILNVVGNALDAVDGCPRPQVLVGSDVDTARKFVRIIVVDNGIGIPNERMEEIFKPFLSTKGASGTGLGLAVSRKILREHGGDIVVKSEPGKGSRFILHLPIRSPLSSDSMGTKADIPRLKL